MERHAVEHEDRARDGLLLWADTGSSGRCLNRASRRGCPTQTLIGQWHPRARLYGRSHQHVPA